MHKLKDPVLTSLHVNPIAYLLTNWNSSFLPSPVFHTPVYGSVLAQAKKSRGIISTSLPLTPISIPPARHVLLLINVLFQLKCYALNNLSGLNNEYFSQSQNCRTVGIWLSLANWSVGCRMGWGLLHVYSFIYFFPEENSSSCLNAG